MTDQARARPAAPATAQQPPQERLAALLAPEMAQVNALIRARMAARHAPRIPEVTAHLIEAGGKRLRPMLTLASARLCGNQGSHHLGLAAAVEFIHTATLLHDDVVDESARRRGRPTANLLWDNKSSVLTGDYLLARAFQLMVETGSLRVLDILANASATISEGEVLQLTAAQSLATDEDTYLQVIRGKTAALFEAACEAGAVVAGASEEAIAALRAYGEALGIAFQMADDLLDYAGSAKWGKERGDDFRERKVTLPVIRAAAAGERDFWSRVIERGEQAEGDFEQALALMHRHGALQSSAETARAWSARAVAALERAPEGELREVLAGIATWVVERLA